MYPSKFGNYSVISSQSSIIIRNNETGESKTYEADKIERLFKDSGFNLRETFYHSLMISKETLETEIKHQENVHGQATKLRRIYQARFGQDFAESKPQQSSITKITDQDDYQNQIMAFFGGSSHDRNWDWHEKNRR